MQPRQQQYQGQRPPPPPQQGQRPPQGPSQPALGPAPSGTPSQPNEGEVEGQPQSQDAPPGPPPDAPPMPPPPEDYSNPCQCCCSLGSAVMWVACVEMCWAIVFLIYILIMYLNFSNASDKRKRREETREDQANIDHWKDHSTAVYSSMFCHFAELFLAILLVIGAVPELRVKWICFTWIFGILLTTVAEIGLAIYDPEIWMIAAASIALLRLYFIYLAYKLGTEIKKWPKQAPVYVQQLGYHIAPNATVYVNQVRQPAVQYYSALPPTRVVYAGGFGLGGYPYGGYGFGGVGWPYDPYYNDSFYFGYGLGHAHYHPYYHNHYYDSGGYYGGGFGGYDTSYDIGGGGGYYDGGGYDGGGYDSGGFGGGYDSGGFDGGYDSGGFDSGGGFDGGYD